TPTPARWWRRSPPAAPTTPGRRHPDPSRQVLVSRPWSRNGSAEDTGGRWPRQGAGRRTTGQARGATPASIPSRWRPRASSRPPSVPEQPRAPAVSPGPPRPGSVGCGCPPEAVAGDIRAEGRAGFSRREGGVWAVPDLPVAAPGTRGSCRPAIEHPRLEQFAEGKGLLRPTSPRTVLTQLCILRQAPVIVPAKPAPVDTARQDRNRSR